jgi:hypothetical protein
MRNVSILFVVMLLLFLSSCGSALVKPMLDDTVEIVAGDGHVLYEYHCDPHKMIDPTDVMNMIKEKGYSIPMG